MSKNKTIAVIEELKKIHAGDLYVKNIEYGDKQFLAVVDTGTGEIVLAVNPSAKAMESVNDAESISELLSQIYNTVEKIKTLQDDLKKINDELQEAIKKMETRNKEIEGRMQSIESKIDQIDERVDMEYVKNDDVLWH